MTSPNEPASPAALSADDLVALVAVVQRLLYFDEEADPPQWTSDLEWDAPEICARLAELLHQSGLTPGDAPDPSPPPAPPSISGV